MISSGLYWLTSNLSFSSFSAPLSSAIKGDFSPCIDCIHNDSVADVSKYLDKDSNTTYWLKIIHLQPSRVSSHGPGHPWKHLCVPVCVAAITGLHFFPIPLKKTVRERLSFKFPVTLILPNLVLSIFVLLTQRFFSFCIFIFSHFDNSDMVKSRFLQKL